MNALLTISIAALLVSCTSKNEPSNAKNTNHRASSTKKLSDTIGTIKTTDYQPVIDSTLIQIPAVNPPESKYCVIKGAIVFKKGTLGAPYRTNGDNGPSFSDREKIQRSENYTYKLELYSGQELSHTAIVDFKNNLHFEIKALKNKTYRVKLYLKTSLDGEFDELASPNFYPNQMKTNNENTIRWNLNRLIFTV